MNSNARSIAKKLFKTKQIIDARVTENIKHITQKEKVLIFDRQCLKTKNFIEPYRTSQSILAKNTYDRSECKTPKHLPKFIKYKF